jgi:Ca2+/Na+ antiporter
MVIRIVSFLCLVIGALGLIRLAFVEEQDTYYSHIAMSLGFMVVGISMMTMAIREYRGGAANYRAYYELLGVYLFGRSARRLYSLS